MPMFAPPERSFSWRIVLLTRSCETHAMRQSHEERNAVATALFPEPELPRRTISRVSSVPTFMWRDRTSRRAGSPFGSAVAGELAWSVTNTGCGQEAYG